jgi:hypothetical protein
MRGMSLDSYRARAVATPMLMANMPAIDDKLGLTQRAEAQRALASMRTNAQTAGAMPAALQAQQAGDDAGNDSPQSYFASSMARGLERYRQMQQQREEAARRGI